MYNRRRQYSFEEVLDKLMRYCAFQERSPQEVLIKADKYGMSKQQKADLLHYLEEENFVDEGRFALAYTSGKVKIKHWGKYKLIEGLRSKGVTQASIQDALESISEEQHKENLQHWLNKKLPIDKDDQKEKAKLYRFLLSKGFESDEISKVLREVGLM
ncbi:MAG: RecX family transcriptional regulator [Vicingaceae bacterium]